ncbi:hypothetical protein TSAR_007970 [Trichomalopsis sarcophagae]|uniref:Neuropeptide F n=1 Tax=Trichomalopsis sarcophagae TaxID=543379 RepID=A0A232F625_9HYME|nr:hypothetical protein TSAR_007970 [Trichomalopsis sarcophagae]
MRVSLAMIHLIYLTLTVVVLGSVSVQSEPEPMARPARPKVFESPDELREYLDNVRDYYSLSGKARYGKRAEPYAMQRSLDFLRMLLAFSRQKQRNQMEKRELLDKDERSKLQIMQPYDRVARYYEIME